jgi:low affinity Fe/Cu permease
MTESRSGAGHRVKVPIAKVAVATKESEPSVLTPREGSLRGGDGFGRFAAHASMWLGSKWAFAAAGMVIVVWGLTGPIFHYSDTWQLVINTGTTIVTFLMVFLIQNTQNRDALAINLKLNELIRAIDAARDQMINIESLSDMELSAIQANYVKIKDGCGDSGGTEEPKDGPSTDADSLRG